MKKIVIFFVLVLAFTSCKTLNNSLGTSFNKNIKAKKLERIIKNNDFEFDYFASKIRVLYQKQTFTANLRMKQDSIIWISLTGPFNIEGARVVITPSHFEMVNKLNRTFYKKPLSYLKNYIPIDVDFPMLENLIIGNFIENRIKTQKIETKDQKYIVQGDIEGLEILYSLFADGKIDSAEIENKEERQSLSFAYSKYENIENKKFPTRRKYTVLDKHIGSVIDLKFYKWNIDKQLFPFDIPSSYKKK